MPREGAADVAPLLRCRSVNPRQLLRPPDQALSLAFAIRPVVKLQEREDFSFRCIGLKGSA
jgi:hypothetical protein